MAYKEITPKVWEYAKEGDMIEGVLVKVEHDIGANKSTIYSLETSPGNFMSIWGSTVLDQKMCLVKIGQKVRITYQGLTEKKAGKNPAKLFKIEVDQEDK